MARSHSPLLAARLRDLGGEALAALLARPQRTALTALGTVIGIAALVTTVGLATTAGAQIVSRFDALAATTVTVTMGGTDSPQARQSIIPWDAPARLERLNGVVAAGTMSSLDLPGVSISATRLVDPLARDSIAAPVVAASPELFPAVRAQLAAGRVFDIGFDTRADRVAVVGRAVASQLNLPDLGRQPAIFIGDQAFTVIGVLADVARAENLLNAVIIPNGAARALYGLPAPTSVVVETSIGAAALITQQAPHALAPNDPDQLIAERPPEPAATRARVADDVRALFLTLGVVSLIIGGIGIANTTLVSVLERTDEIGLRRSLGASRRWIAALFIVESTLTGALGGILGASAGTLTTVAVSAIRQWTPVVDGRLAPGAALTAALVGLAAGAYPALRASRVEPIAALRSRN